MSETETAYNQTESLDEKSRAMLRLVAEAEMGEVSLSKFVEFEETDIFDNVADYDEEIDEELSDSEIFIKSEVELEENFRIVENGKVRDQIVRELLEQYKDHPKVLLANEKLKNNEAQESCAPSHRYFQEIRRYELLTHEQEQSLFRTLELGINNWLKSRSAEADFDENALIDAVIAQQAIYLSNLRLVLRFAFGKARQDKIEAFDLIQEGNDGLAHAINRFDYQRGLKFSTYAVLWIRQRMQKHIFEKADIIRIPNYMQEKRDDVFLAYESLKQILGREPTIQEVCDETGQPKDKVKEIFISGTLKETISLDTPLENVDGDLTIVDGVKSSEELEENKIVHGLFTDEIIDIVFGGDILTLKEKYVLSLRYGVMAEKLMGTSLRVSGNKRVHYNQLIDDLLSGESTLDSVGQIFGLTRERIRQIHKKALGHLQSSEQIHKMAQ